MSQGPPLNLLKWFRQGLIPGPDESEAAFLGRVQQSPPLAHIEWQEVQQATLPTLGFAIDWVPLTYSRKNLRPWEGAVTWISDDQLPSIQLNPSFQKGTYLGYHRSDVLSHEAIHAARVRFHEPVFEEMLAYSIAPQAWKRFWGPFFSRPWEIWVLFASLLLGLLLPWLPCLILGGAAGRLFFRHTLFRKCRTRFSLPFMICLTDAEIKKFAHLSKEVVKAELQKQSDLRSKLLQQLLE